MKRAQTGDARSGATPDWDRLGRRALRRQILHPAHPERICWGCDLYCSADALRCGNGTERTQHPSELFGEDWDTWGNQR